MGLRAGRAITLRRRDLSLAPIFAHVHWHELPLEEFIQLDFHQDVIAQARAFHPVLGQFLLGATSQALERVGGQRGAEFDQPLSSVSLFALAAELFLNSRSCLSPRLFHLRTRVPGR